MVKLKNLRPRCFFDVSINKENVGRIIFELFNDVCPKTCENFKTLCTGEKGIGKLTGKPLHYKNVPFHRVVKNFIIQSGDFSLGNGKGGESIYGGTFEDETFHFKHEKPFLLSMANRGPNTNGSQFFITLSPAPHLDGVHVVFGHVIAGQDVVLKISEQPVDKQNRPTIPINISNCGELVPQIKPKEKSKSKKRKRHASDSSSNSSSASSSSNDSSSSSSSSDDEENDKEKPSKSKNTVEEKSNDNKIEDNEQKDSELDSISLFNPKYSVKINQEEIPEIPKNKFLDRVDTEKLKLQKEITKPHIRRYSYDRSGRQIKGRGTIRYRTPSPEYGRSRRSETPPHWRHEQQRLKSFEQVLARHKRRKNQQSEKSSEDNNKKDDNRSRSRSRERKTFKYRDDHRRNDRPKTDRNHFDDKTTHHHHSRSFNECHYEYKERKKDLKDDNTNKDNKINKDEELKNGKIEKHDKKNENRKHSSDELNDKKHDEKFEKRKSKHEDDHRNDDDGHKHRIKSSKEKSSSSSKRSHHRHHHDHHRNKESLSVK